MAEENNTLALKKLVYFSHKNNSSGTYVFFYVINSPSINNGKLNELILSWSPLHGSLRIQSVVWHFLFLDDDVGRIVPAVVQNKAII